MAPMTRRQKAIGFFVALCILLVAATVSLNITWIMSERRVVALVFGMVVFAFIIAGLIIYTVFLVMEIKRNEEHDSFINAVTHELKTPIASIRLYLQTLQSREVGEEKRREFYDIMLADATRLHDTVDQVLKAGVARERAKGQARAVVDVAALTRECVDLATVRHHLPPGAIDLQSHDTTGLTVRGGRHPGGRTLRRPSPRFRSGRRSRIFSGRRARGTTLPAMAHHATNAYRRGAAPGRLSTRR